MSVLGRIVAILLAFLPFVALADGKSPCDTAQEISFSEARNRTLASPSPEIPPLAKATGIGGVVKIEICVSEKGEVTSTKLISGHPLLVGAAMSDVKAWRFKSSEAPSAP